MAGSRGWHSNPRNLFCSDFTKPRPLSNLTPLPTPRLTLTTAKDQCPLYSEVQTEGVDQVQPNGRSAPTCQPQPAPSPWRMYYPGLTSQSNYLGLPAVFVLSHRYSLRHRPSAQQCNIFEAKFERGQGQREKERPGANHQEKLCPTSNSTS